MCVAVAVMVHVLQQQRKRYVLQCKAVCVAVAAQLQFKAVCVAVAVPGGVLLLC